MFENIRNKKAKLNDIDFYKKAAVLVPLIETERGWEILFEVRAANLRFQPGEICFPGGGIEDQEGSIDCAVRETTEELLINRSDIDVICELDYFITPYNLLVHPVLGIIKNYKGTYSKYEVENTFTVPVNYLMNMKPKVYTNVVTTQTQEGFPYELVPGGIDYNWAFGVCSVYFYEYEGRVIWGITAKILKAALDELRYVI